MLRRRLHFERLEDRRLLAVTVNFSSSTGQLNIFGDGASDAVAIDGRGVMGRVSVQVNGAVRLVPQGVNSINVVMGAGSDVLDISALLIGGSLTVNMGSGSDRVDLDNMANLAGGGVSGNMFIGGHTTINMGGNAGDLVEFDQSNLFSNFIGGNLTLLLVADVNLNGNGASFQTDNSDITVGGSLTVGLTPFGDVNGDFITVDIDDLNVGGFTTITGSSAADVVRFTDSSFVRNVNISLLGGSDVLNIGATGNPNRFQAQIAFYGGSGTDTLDNTGANQFAFPIKKFSVENEI